MKDKTEKFTQKELSDLKKELRSMYVTAITLYIMIFVLYQSLVYYKYNSFNVLSAELIWIGISVLTYKISLYFMKGIKTEVKQGLKIIKHFKIENKFSYLDRIDYLSPEYMRYIISAGGINYTVSEEKYNKAEIKDYLAVHKTAIREIKINTEIVKNENFDFIH